MHKRNVQADREGSPTIHGQILSLAVPALGALVAEPIFTLADSAMVGHLGTAQLGGLAVASTILLTVVGLCIFLAYTTTAVTARRVGAGDVAGGLRHGIDGLWLAVILGFVLAVGLAATASPVVVALGADADAAPHAVAYLQYSAPGLPGMLLVLAATGVLRGMLDTRTPLYVATAGAVANVGLNALFIYGLDMGVGGSGLGTAVTQSLMGAYLTITVWNHARRLQVRPALNLRGLWKSFVTGMPLLVRTATLRIAILATVSVVAGLGPVALAGHQIVNAVWALTADVLDALAIAAQALVGQGLGAGKESQVRRVLRTCLRWGVGAGVVIGLMLVALSWWLPHLFTPDAPVRSAATAGLVVVGALMPLAGWVFVLDGVLIGAGDGRYLAFAGVLTLVAYLPALGLVATFAPSGLWGLVWLWVSFAGVFMLARALTTGWRARGSAWMRIGAA